MHDVTILSQVVFPAFVSWHDVIEIQVNLRENLGTILAGVFVTKKNVLPCELNLLARGHDHTALKQ